MNWLVASILSVILFSITNGIARGFQGKIHPLFALVPQLIGSLIVAVLLSLGYKSIAPKIGTFTTQGAILAVIAGVSWVLAQLLYYTALSKNAPLSVAIPIISGGIIVGGVVAGALFFSEQLGASRIIGIILVLIGSILLART